MGTNRRYARQIDRRMDLSIAARSGALCTLSAEELDLENAPLTVDPHPRAVHAWVRFGDTPIRVDARAARWTPYAVGVEFTIDDTTHRCWVWRGAVRRR